MPILAPYTPAAQPSGVVPMILAPLDTCSFGNVTLGLTDSNGVEWYLLDIDGWGSPQSAVQAIQKTAADGAFLTPSYFQPRTVSITGAIFAPSRPLLVAAKNTLNSVGIQPIPLTVTEGGFSSYVVATRQSDIQFKETSDVSCEFTIQWVCADYRKFATQQLTATTALPSVSGGLLIPFTIPFTISSSVVSGGVTLVNDGNVPGPVVCRFTGPLVAPQVTHVDASGNALVWSSSITLGPLDYLDVNMDDGAHTVILNGDAPRDQYTTSRQWPMFTPGLNQWSFSAASGSGSLLVTATPAYA